MYDQTGSTDNDFSNGGYNHQGSSNFNGFGNFRNTGAHGFEDLFKDIFGNRGAN